MKILEINKFNYLQGGADKHFLDLIQLLESKGEEVAIFAMDSPKNESSPWKKYFVSYVGYNAGDTVWQKIKGVARMFYSLEAKRKIRRLLDDFRPDMVHIHNIYHQISPSILPEMKKQNVPVIMTVHDYKLICPNYLFVCEDKGWDFIKKKRFKNSYFKSLLVVLEFKFHKWLDIYDKNIDLYISPSAFTRQKLIQGGIKKEKVIILPHFYPDDIPAEYQQVEENTRDEKYVLHYGRLSRAKGTDKLIEIFQNLPEINLYLAGAIEDDLVIPNAKNIKHLGFLNPGELKRHIKNSLFVVSPSRLPETFGLIALEALASGKPFVGYAGGSFARVVEDGKAGYLCQSEGEMSEKIRRLATDEGLRLLFGKNALKWAKNFNSNIYYAKFLESVDKIRK